MTDSIFDMLYADVPSDQRNALQAFRKSHPESYVKSNGTEWALIDSGGGEKALLLLVGGLRVADAAYANILMLDDEFRVLAPTYPALNSMAALADGLASLLTAKGIDQCAVLAGSFGGMLAQVFVRRHPEKVLQLILSTTAVLDAETVERYRQGLMMLQPMSDQQVAEVSEQIMFGIIAPPEESHAFYRAYLKELYGHRLSRQDIISTYEALIDFAENYTFRAEDLKNWSGELLILESDDDATFDAQTRQAVKTIYPQAQTYVFHGAGHSPGTTQRDLYFRVVKAFLRRESLPNA